jgi:hypothetical protein
MLFLPFPPRRIWLRSFWGVFAFSCGLLCSFMLSRYGVAFSCGWAALLTLTLGAAGFCWPQLIVKLYSLWNSLILFMRQGLRWAVLGICYYVVILAVGRTGSCLQLVRPAPTVSLWRPRGTLAPHAYAHQYVPPSPSPEHHGWIRTYITWAKRSHNLWAVCLLPLLLVLTVVVPDQSTKRFPANIYTLF